MIKNFVIIGASGYIAQRHIKCIADLGHNLMAVCDPSDSIGIVDKYFDDTLYFKSTDELNEYFFYGNQQQPDYIVICSPNYLHFTHIMQYLPYADIICEKPLITESGLMEILVQAEKETGNKIYPILQARIHPTIQKLKKLIDPKKTYDVEMIYMSKRSDWYLKSWKADLNKSGGLLMNIGIHGFDVCSYLFGIQNGIMSTSTDGVRHQQYSTGTIKYKNANVKFEVSTNLNQIRKHTDKNVIRLLKIKGIGEFEFSDGFCDLHIELYKKILNDEWNINIESLQSTINICRSNEYV